MEFIFRGFGNFFDGFPVRLFPVIGLMVVFQFDADVFTLAKIGGAQLALLVKKLFAGFISLVGGL